MRKATKLVLILVILGFALIIIGGVAILIFGPRFAYFDSNGYKVGKTVRVPVEPYYSYGLIMLLASPFVLLSSFIAALAILVHRKLQKSKETKPMGKRLGEN